MVVVVIVVVVAVQRHLNGQVAVVAGSPHVRRGQSEATSGTGEVAQLNVSQRVPVNPVPHLQAHAARSKLKPF